MKRNKRVADSICYCKYSSFSRINTRVIRSTKLTVSEYQNRLKQAVVFEEEK
jgi:hypothetical protein